MNLGSKININQAFIAIIDGEVIEDESLAIAQLQLSRRARLNEVACRELQENIILALDRLGNFISSNKLEILSQLELDNEDEKAALELQLDGVALFIQQKNIRLKLKREFGRVDIFSLRQVEEDNSHQTQENYSPLGRILHLTPGNSPFLGFLAGIEGVLGLNHNIVRPGREDLRFSLILWQAMLQSDRQGLLSSRMHLVSFPSRSHKTLKHMIDCCDAVSAWGGEDALKEIRALVPPEKRWIAWGHKLSFSYFDSYSLTNLDEIKGLAQTIVSGNQLSCSSPQCVLVEVATPVQAYQFATKVFEQMLSLSQEQPALPIDMSDLAEIQNTVMLHKHECLLGDGQVLEDKKSGVRVLVNFEKRLHPSPLYRTLWVVPISVSDDLSFLLPVRSYLQTAGLAAKADAFLKIAQKLLTSGCTRVTTPAQMMDSYEGEPHDGEIGTSRFLKRTSITFPKIDENAKLPLTDKEYFQNSCKDNEHAKLFFKSGGSSGKTTLSTFSYSDYHQLMAGAAKGLLAAGLDPENDRVMNLFFGGGLYGGMISFFTILEKIEALQFPMGAHLDFEMVASSILEFKVDTLIGMPSYILNLCKDQEVRLKEYAGIKKIFYGGEHFTQGQKDYLQNVIGVTEIHSASYGSVDAGPLGYQCTFLRNGEHHLHTSMHKFEIVSLTKDSAALPQEIGRLVVSTPWRQASVVSRYVVGDIGRLIERQCPCGSHDQIFDLMGRTGDIFRVGGTFLNNNKIQTIIQSEFNFSGEMQIVIKNEGLKDGLVFILDDTFNSAWEKILPTISAKYFEFNEVLNLEAAISARVEIRKSRDLLRSKGSGKLLKIIDERMTS